MADLLRNDYKDDILNTDVNTQRKYRMVENGDGTVSFEDVTAYEQVGDSFGAADINKTNLAIDELNNALSGTVLWENPNPSSQMGAYTLDIDLNGYKNITIKFRNYVAEDYLVTMGNINVGERYVAIGMLNNGITTRFVKVDSDCIVFATGMYTGGEAGSVLVPYQVMGY